MNIDWQLAISLLVLLTATAVIGRRVWRLVSGTGESGCGNCDSKGLPRDRSTIKPLVTLDDSPPLEHGPPT